MPTLQRYLISGPVRGTDSGRKRPVRSGRILERVRDQSPLPRAHPGSCRGLAPRRHRGGNLAQHRPGSSRRVAELPRVRTEALDGILAAVAAAVTR